MNAGNRRTDGAEATGGKLTSSIRNDHFRFMETPMRKRRSTAITRKIAQQSLTAGLSCMPWAKMKSDLYWTTA